jgi:hypothetical protein
MSRLGVAGAVLALLALSACGANPEREKRAKELAAAEKKVAEAKAHNEDLEREKQLITTKLEQEQAQLAEVQAAYHGTLAGAAYLTEEGGLSMTWEMYAAREGFLLAEAVRGKDEKGVEGFAAKVLAGERPCAPSEDAEGEGEGEGGCSPCSVAPFEDACTDVEKNTSSSPDWSCAEVARTGDGLPPAAFCTSTLEHPAPGTGVDSPYAEQSLPTALQVVRVAFAHGGRLYVSDYPKPEPVLYNPPNVGPLVECKATTARNECVHQCEVTYNRYEDPCACEPEDAHDDHDHDGEGGEDESDEPAEVRQARLAAAEAEAEAQAARERAEAAQQEVAFQECLAACEPRSEVEVDPPEDDEEAEAPVVPVSTTVKASLAASPAPGVFVVSRVVQALDAGGAVTDETKSTLLLKHPGLVALWQKKALPPSETLGELESIGELDEVMSSGGKLSLAPLPGMKEPALVGLRAGVVKAYAFQKQQGPEPVVELERAAVCAAVSAEPKRFPEEYVKACAEPPKAIPAEAAAGTPGASEVSADAGPAAPTDAGTAADAGEVAP